MGAAWYRARADLRRGIGGTIVLIALVALAGGVALAAAAGSMRTRNALPEFLAYNNAPDAAVFVDPELPGDQQSDLLQQVLALPEWDGAALIATAGVTLEPEADGGLVMVATAIRDAEFPLQLSRPIIVDGRQPDPSAATDAVINEVMADGLGVDVGDTFDLRSITSENLEAFGNGRVQSDPDGTDFAMEVVAIQREPTDLQEPGAPHVEGVFAPESWTLTLMPAFWDAVDGDVASYGSGVLGHLAPGVTADDLSRAVAEIDTDSFFVESSNEDEQLLGSIRRATDFEATALLLFAVVVLIAGMALVGQVIARQVAIRLDDSESLRASGLTRLQRAAVALPRMAVVALAGMVVAVMVAIVLSPLAPVGLARRAELHPGIDVDSAVLLLGGTSLVLLVVGWGLAMALRATSAPGSRTLRRDRPSAVGAWLATAGASVTTVAGVRLALERGRGRSAVPVVSTLLAGVAGVFMVTAVLTFSLSLDHLVDTPALQGWTWDVVVGNYARQESVDEGAQTLSDNPMVAGYLGGNVQAVRLDGQSANIAAIGPGDPTIGPPVIEGRRPDATDEIALGRRTLSDLGKDIGDTVEVSADSGGAAVETTIVGTVVLPAGVSDTLTLADGGLMTLDGLRAVYGPQGDLIVSQSFFVTFADGVTAAEGVTSLQPDFRDTVVLPTAPDDIENLRRVQGLPGVLALTVSVLAAGTLANTLVTCVRRRRRDLATFATLGFRPRQIAWTVAWQATTIAALALAVGLPLGVAAGRTVWALIMTSIGTSVAAVTPWAGLAVVVAAVVGGANAIAALPARRAAHTHPATTLRSE